VLWRYERGTDEICCEIRPAPEGFDLQLTRHGRTTYEHIANATTALRRQLALERRLLVDGWRLTCFDPIARLEGRRG